MIDLRAASFDAVKSLNEALQHHALGQIREAEAGYREILARELGPGDPAHVRALGMLALILAEGDDKAAAEAALTEHLALDPDSAASHLAMGRLRTSQGDVKAALALLTRAAELQPDLAPIHNEIGICLHEVGRWPEALEALDRAADLDPGYYAAQVNRAKVLTALGRLEEAETAARLALAGGASASDTTEQLAAILLRLNRRDEALSLLDDLSRQAGLQGSGRTDAEAPKVLLLGAVGGGHVPTRYLLDPRAFSIASLSLLSPAAPDAPLGAVDMERLTRADVVFCALGDVDRDQFGQLAAAEALCAELGKPVVNPPDRVRRTARDAAPELFAGVDGLIVPRARRTTPAELADLVIDSPILVRPPGTHNGDNLVRIADEAEKAAYLENGPPEQLILTPYVDTRSPDGFWRKYRLVFVDRRPYPFHLAIVEAWLAHYWRGGMARNEWKRTEEERFLADWRGVFGERGAAAIDEVGRRLDLDYGGIDCALTADGQVVLFEANACILLHLDEPETLFPYKHRFVPQARDAFTRLIRERAGFPPEPAT
ncbi:tetratricopeptide repeat protein [Phenylobacterium sp.]|uniref:tetratricopeptide repeat protein n=1 Tax=Phenylobacterium sp. TaxID=1871053 RepID=UPI0012181D88|nr:tetratricopeptide repeat protein [Phenylobacterium sp.]THD58580.1 MAG: tetratricopeptide repeat protein [Phenylobacterium sp.]